MRKRSTPSTEMSPFYCLIGREEASARALGQLAGTSQLLHATACLLAGKRLMAHSSIKAFLAVYAHKASVEDCCLAYAQLGYSTAEREGFEAGMKVGTALWKTDVIWVRLHRPYIWTDNLAALNLNPKPHCIRLRIKQFLKERIRYSLGSAPTLPRRGSRATPAQSRQSSKHQAQLFLMSIDSQYVAIF